MKTRGKATHSPGWTTSVHPAGQTSWVAEAITLRDELKTLGWPHDLIAIQADGPSEFHLVLAWPSQGGTPAILRRVSTSAEAARYLPFVPPKQYGEWGRLDDSSSAARARQKRVAYPPREIEPRLDASEGEKPESSPDRGVSVGRSTARSRQRVAVTHG